MQFMQDDIHGPMAFHEAAWAVIDTRPMQRLRGIKQLGATSYVFSSGCHARCDAYLGAVQVNACVWGVTNVTKGATRGCMRYTCHNRCDTWLGALCMSQQV